MYTCKPGYEEAQRRVNMFWNHEDADRPLVNISFPKPGAEPFPEKKYATQEARWLDVNYRIDSSAHNAENTVFYADSMPVVYPNLGPEIFSAWSGCPYIFGETTTWTEPCIDDWDRDGPKAVTDRRHPLYIILDDFAKGLIERGKGNFIVGLTDFHPGGDHVAALRDPERFAVDLLEHPEKVRRKLASSYPEYYPIYDYFTKMIKDAGMPVATWTPLPSEETMYVPSNDFSCMISTEMFVDFFLDGIIGECKHYAHSIYHLDGRDALRHLNVILSIPELNALQWVPGAGHEQVSRWINVYKRVLAAGKSIQINGVYPDDLPLLMENLPARGVWLCMRGIGDEETAANVMKTIERWGKR